MSPAIRPPLFQHQVEAIELAWMHNGFMLAHEMGTGKSRTIIELLDREQRACVLVLCPASVVPVWPDQARQWSDRPWLAWYGNVASRRGGHLKNPSVARRAEALIEAGRTARAATRPLMAVVNYDAAHPRAMADLLKRAQWDAVILDESHRIKQPGGAWSRLATIVCNRTRERGGRIIAGTGTPMPHGPLDLFAQIRALDGGARLGTNAQVFKARFAGRKVWKIARGGEPITMIGPAGEALWPLGAKRRGRTIRQAVAGELIYAVGPRGEVLYEGLAEQAAPEFYNLIAPIWHRVRADDVLDLPDSTDVHRECDLTPRGQQAYEDLERDLITQLPGGVVTAANAMVLTTRLAQVTGGFARDAETGADHEVDDSKARLLADVLEDLPPHEPIVVFCRFHHDLDVVQRVAKHGGRRYAELSGRRKDALDGPRMREDIDTAGVQLQAGGVGIDLTRARYAIYYSVAYALADYLQSRARLRRQGQHRNVVYTHLLARDSIDQHVYDALRRREEIVDTVITHLTRRSSNT